jgi:glycerol uptake facilitator-like aquaporin
MDAVSHPRVGQRPSGEVRIVCAGNHRTSVQSANPAITIARALTDSFTGIAPAHVPGFIAAQFAGGLAAHWLERVLYPDG